jgi:hypothetical protein
MDFIGLKSQNQRRNLRELKQIGKTDIKRDVVRNALKSGKRISSTGKVYWETRKNRSDGLNKI